MHRRQNFTLKVNVSNKTAHSLAESVIFFRGAHHSEQVAKNAGFFLEPFSKNALIRHLQ
jgi:hypothetical protein